MCSQSQEASCRRKKTDTETDRSTKRFSEECPAASLPSRSTAYKAQPGPPQHGRERSASRTLRSFPSVRSCPFGCDATICPSAVTIAAVLLFGPTSGVLQFYSVARVALCAPSLIARCPPSRCPPPAARCPLLPAVRAPVACRLSARRPYASFCVVVDPYLNLVLPCPLLRSHPVNQLAAVMKRPSCSVARQPLPAGKRRLFRGGPRSLTESVT